MNNLEKSNTRFIYKVLQEDFSNILEIIESVDSYIFHEKSLDYQHRQIIIYYHEGEFWAGKEVIGFPTNLPKELNYSDFKGLALELIHRDCLLASYSDLKHYCQKNITDESTYIKIKLKNSPKLQFDSYRTA